MADRVWGSGKVTAQPIERAISSVGLGPDFEVVGVTNPPVMVLHRHLADGEVYFLSNRKGRPFSGDVAFRVTQLLDNLKDVLAKRSCSMSTG